MADDGLTPAESATLLDLIETERARTIAQIGGLTREFDGVVEWSRTPPDDEHDPEGATLAFERAQVTAMLSHARSQLADLDLAREQLRHGSYGRCRRCGRRIVFERLLARPTAQTCVECAVGRSPRRQA
jgi:DnaK suppressor protein